MDASDLGKQLKANSNWYRISNIDDPEEIIRLWVSCSHCEGPLIDPETLKESIAKVSDSKHWLTLVKEELIQCDCLERGCDDEDSE